MIDSMGQKKDQIKNYGDGRMKRNGFRYSLRANAAYNRELYDKPVSEEVL